MKLSRRTIIISSIIAIVLAGGIFAYAKAKNDRNNSNQADQAANSSDGADTSQAQGDQATSEQQPNGVTVVTPDSKVSNAPSASSQTGELAAPDGVFVSNHKPSLSASNQMSSSCRTTVGATCEIRFTKAGEVKILGPNKVGVDGSILWYWTLQQIGLSQGSWQIEAVVTLNGKTAAARDTIGLEVSP